MKNINNLLLAATVALACFSCSKRAENNLEKESNSSLSQLSRIRPLLSSSIIPDSNALNPYDTVGIRHNSGCAALMSEVNPSSSTLNADILNYTKQYLASTGYDTTTFDTIYNYITTNGYYSIPDSVNADTPTTLFTHLYNNGLITLTTKNYLNTFNTIVNTSITSDTPTQTMYNRAASQIASVETEIYYDSSLPPSEKESLYIMGSVYRFSGAYWGTYIINNGTTSGIHIHLHWKGFWSHDASGAIAGSIGGYTAADNRRGRAAIIGGVGGGIGTSIAYVFTGN